MTEGIELRAVIACKQGLSCSGYYRLAAETKYLKERLYVTVADGDKLFLPQADEHFPVAEIEAYYIGNIGLGVAESIGAGGGEIVFACEGPAADEGATVISATLAGLDAVLNQNMFARFIASTSTQWDYFKPQPSGPPYRLPALPTRPGVPAPQTETETFDKMVVHRWRAWGWHGLDALRHEAIQKRKRGGLT